MARLKHAQQLMFRKMLKTKRLVLPNKEYEPWLDWHIRSFRKAWQAVRDFDISVKDKLESLKRSWAGHGEIWFTQGW